MRVRNNIKKTAFTAFELVVVLAFLGLLIAGVVISKGNLISKAKINHIITSTKNSPIKDMEGAVMWFEVATKDSFRNSEIVENGGITEWKNISPENYHKFNVEQSNSTQRPLYVFDDYDELPLIRFDGSDDILATSTTVSGYELAKRDQATVFLVQKHGSGNNTVINWNGGGTSNRFLVHATNDSAIYWDFGNISSGGRVSTIPTNFYNKWKIITLVREYSDNGVIRVDGTQLVRTTMNDDFDISTNATLNIGDSSDVDLREIIIFKRELNSQEIAEVEDYLSDKWDIDLN